MPGTTDRPRLFIDGERLAELRRAVSSTHAFLWERLVRTTDGMLDASRDAERYRDLVRRGRGWGTQLHCVVERAAVGGEEEFVDLARRAALDRAKETAWRDTDMGCGYTLLSLSLAYDWLYESFSPDERAAVARAMAEAAEELSVAADEERRWWHDYFLQNHGAVSYAGMYAAAAALQGEELSGCRYGPEGWTGLADRFFTRALDYLDPEGSCVEGSGYWSSYADPFLRYALLARGRGSSEAYDSDWLRNTWRFGLHLMLPGARAGDYAESFGDSSRGANHGPAQMFFFAAARNRDGVAQWAGRRLSEISFETELWRQGGHPRPDFLELLTYDPTVEPEPPEKEPTLMRFSDTDVALMRSGWGEGASYSYFRCGPLIGRKASRLTDRDLGACHTHADVGNFTFYARGRHLIVDVGYGRRLAEHHNTFLIDGAGQLGEARDFPTVANEFFYHHVEDIRIVAAESGEGFHYVAGDLGSVYGPRSPVKSIVRHLVTLGADGVFLLDECEFSRLTSVASLFHLEGRARRAKGGVVRCRNGGVLLEGRAFLPRGAKVELAPERGAVERIRRITEEPVWEMRLSPPRRVKKCVFAVLFAASAGTKAVLSARFGRRKGVYRLSARLDGTDYLVALDAHARRVRVELAWPAGHELIRRDARPPVQWGRDGCGSGQGV